MFIALLIIHVIVAVSLVLIVLLQTGRGAELGAAFGGTGQASFGRGQSTVLSKVTTAMAVIFMTTSMSLAFLSTDHPAQSILSEVKTVVPKPAAEEPKPEAMKESSEGAPAPVTAPVLPQTQAPAQQGGSSDK